MSENEPQPTDASPETPSIDPVLKRFSNRLGLGAILTLLMLHVVFCFYFVYDPRCELRRPQSNTARQMERTSHRLEEYRKKRGRFPDRLEFLYADRPGMESYRQYETSDGWRRPMVYTSNGDSWQLLSYGSDGRPDGVGLATDILVDNTMRKETIGNITDPYKPTLRQLYDGGWIRDVLFGYATLFVMFFVYALFLRLFSLLLDMPLAPLPRNRLDVVVQISIGFLVIAWAVYFNALVVIIKPTH